MKRLLGCACALAVLVLPGCSSVTQGSGHGQSSANGPSTPDFPSTPPSQPPPSAPAATSSAAASTAASTPTIRQRGDRLTAQTNGEAHELVALPGGAEAATYDTAGNIQFWRSVGGSVNWTQVGASKYPDEVTGRPFRVAVRGALLARMRHPTFIVTGQFTTDNSGRAVAYTTGTPGWGAIKAESNGNIGPSGQPIGSDRIGLSYDFGFAGGKLKTEDCPDNKPIATCGSDHVDKLWTWTGQDFVQS